jgi:hypothetical protein
MIDSSAPPTPIAQQAPRDATLDVLLRRFAFAQLPSRFYSLLQVSAPLAIQAWQLGWHRTAGWLFALATFGVWALAQQRLQGHADLLTETAPPPSRMWRVLRRTAAIVTGLSVGLLAAEGFVQIMALIFNCPGCAG